MSATGWPCETEDVELTEVVTRLRSAGCVLAEREAELLLQAPGDLPQLLERRVSGERLEDVLGWAEFCGRRYVITPGVFVPRHRSEFLVDLAVAHARPGNDVLDLCCGVGALAGAVSDRVPGLSVHAVDLDPAAVSCARENLPGARVLQGDLFGPLPHRRFDLVVANVPYVPHTEIAHLPVEMREHENPATLDGGSDGLGVLRRVLADVGPWLSPHGRLFVELEEDQVAPATECAHHHGLSAEDHVRPPHDEWDDATHVLSLSRTQSDGNASATT